MDRKEQTRKLLQRRVECDVNGKLTGAFPSEEDVVKRLASDKALTFYLGVDPTGPQVHIGHTIPLLLLKGLAELGHKAIFLIGNFTARIGDPTDKGAARHTLLPEEVEENSKTYIDQVEKIFNGVPFEVRYNADWLETMTLEELIRLASRATVQQMLARDMFRERIKQEKPIYVHEFLYPLMQGYDSVAMQVDGEVGGNDQTFNMLMGRELEKELLGKDKIVLANRLLVDGTTGVKMSKSEGGLIALDDSPRIIFEKVGRTISNEILRTAFELCTERDESWITETFAVSKTDYRELNLALAHELVTMYYDQEIADKALETYKTIADGGVPEDSIEVGEIKEGETFSDLISRGLNISKSEAKRLVNQKGVRHLRDGREELVTDPLAPAVIDPGDALRIGAGKFIRLK